MIESPVYCSKLYSSLQWLVYDMVESSLSKHILGIYIAHAYEQKLPLSTYFFSRPTFFSN